MTLKLFSLTLLCGSIAAASVVFPPENALPSFDWLNENSVDGIPNLAINFPDGREYTAILRRLNLFSQELRSSRFSSDDCIFEGFLKNDLDSRLILTGGCPGDNTFEISITGRTVGSFRLKVTAGSVTKIPSFNNEFQGGYKIDAIETTNGQKYSQKSASSVPLPSEGFVFRIGVIYDDPWLNSYGSHEESINAVTRVVAHGQFFFYWPSLTVPVTLEIAHVAHQSVHLTMGSGLDVLIPFATDSSINTYVGMTTAEGGGIAYVGTICGDMKYRTALVGKTDSISEAIGGEIMGHELGHSLGMPHDFIEPYTQPKTIRYDSQGESCTDINALMDYDKKSVDLWSRCSIEHFTENYNNIIAAQGSFCMAPGGIKFEHGDPNTLWATGCDLGGNDIDMVILEPEKCGQACADHGQCTHFAGSLGNCWLKFVDGVNTKMAYRVDYGYETMCGIYCGHPSSRC